MAKLDPSFGYADRVDPATGKYERLCWAKTPTEIFPDTAVIIRREAALAQLAAEQPSASSLWAPTAHPTAGPSAPQPASGPTASPAEKKPTRFYGSVEISIERPVKSLRRDFSMPW